jgi:hypothetical protein
MTEHKIFLTNGPSVEMKFGGIIAHESLFFWPVFIAFLHAAMYGMPRQDSGLLRQSCKLLDSRYLSARSRM